MSRLKYFAIVILFSGCHQPFQTPMSASVPVETVASVSSTPAPAVVVPPVVVGPPVAADPPAVDPNCSEKDPKKWIGFSWMVYVDTVEMRNFSSCDRLVTWRAFNAKSANDQPPLGDAVLALVPAGAGVGEVRPYVLKIHYYGNGLPPCGTVIQPDGRAGNQPGMNHENASFTPGRLFEMPSCPVAPPTPVAPPVPPQNPVCVVQPAGPCSGWTLAGNGAHGLPNECAKKTWTRSCPMTCGAAPIVETVLSCEKP